MNNTIKKTIPLIATLTFSALLAVSATNVFASGDHGHSHDSGSSKHESSGHDDHGSDHNGGHEDGHGHDKKMSGMFLKKKHIDGYTVSFHVMKAKSGMENGGSHNFMIKVEKDGKALTNVVINSKIVHPNNQSESKMLMKMGDWYMGGYDLGHKGKHQLMILFKTSDGKKHKGGVYYAG